MFCGSAASPPWRRPRRCSRAAGASLSCLCSLRRRRRTGDGCTEGRWWRSEAAAAWAWGLLVVDLATSGEVGWRLPQIWSGRCSGLFPGRWRSTVFISSSSELVNLAAHQRLRARGSSVLWVRAPGGCCLRRLRRRSSTAAEALVVVGGVTQRWRPCILFFLACVCSCFVFLHA